MGDKDGAVELLKEVVKDGDADSAAAPSSSSPARLAAVNFPALP